MLSLFPQILYLSWYSFALLRLAAGLVFLYLAYSHWKNRDGVSKELSMIIGTSGFISILYPILEFLVAVSLILGFLTQLGALVGFIIAAKDLLIRRSLKELKPLSELSYALIAVMCVCLIISGAGPLGFDLPL